jgi:hypothetical protein
MIRLGKTTNQNTAQVLARAIHYFGPAGLGLEVGRQDEASVQFQGGGGFVSVHALPSAASGKTEVEIESREWDHDAQRFLEEI